MCVCVCVCVGGGGGAVNSYCSASLHPAPSVLAKKKKIKKIKKERKKKKIKHRSTHFFFKFLHPNK